jgi:hypothetical protein
MNIKACLLYFRPGPDLQVEIGEVGTSDICHVYLLNRDGDVRPVRHAVETLVKSLHQWLDAPENGGFEADVFKLGDKVYAHQVPELGVLFDDLEDKEV